MTTPWTWSFWCGSSRSAARCRHRLIAKSSLTNELRPTYVLALREGYAEEAFTALKGEYRRAVRAAAAAAAATAGTSAGAAAAGEGLAPYDEGSVLHKEMQDAVAAAAFVERRWAFVHDPTGRDRRAAKFYRYMYQGGACA